jgi:hypothetical protein
MPRRSIPNPLERNFQPQGTAPTAAWSAFRQRVPLGQGAAREDSQSAALAAAEFLKSTAASSFYRGSGEP